jgi:hypothetical protein
MLAFVFYTLIYFSTFLEGRSFLDANVGLLFTHWSMVVLLAGLLAAAGIAIAMARVRMRAWAVLVGVASLAALAGVASGSPLLTRCALCVLALPSWALVPQWLDTLRHAELRPGSLRDWSVTVAMLLAALLFVVLGSSAYVLFNHPGLAFSASDMIGVFSKTAAMAGIGTYLLGAACWVAILIFRRFQCGALLILLAMGFGLLVTACAVFLKGLEPVDPTPIRLTNTLFVLVHATPLVLAFCRAVSRLPLALPQSLARMLSLRLLWTQGSTAARLLTTAVALCLLIGIQQQIGRWNLLYSWGASTTVLYSSIAFLATAFLLTLLSARVARVVIIGVMLLPIGAGLVLTGGPVRASAWSAYLGHDRIIGGALGAYTHFMPAADPLSKSLRGVLAESSRRIRSTATPVPKADLKLIEGAPRPHVIMIVADGLRRSSYGDPPNDGTRYPGLAMLKQSTQEYSNAWTSYNATSGSVPAYLAGAFNPTWYEARNHIEHDNVLARAASMAGYQLVHYATYAGLDAHWPEGTGLSAPEGLGLGDPATVFPAALTELDTRIAKEKGPVFLYLHLYNNHQPLLFRASAPYDPRGRHWMLALYENNVAYFDQQLRIFLSALASRHLLDSSVVLLMADHGEELFEYGGLYHGWQINPEIMRVPLYLHLPTDTPGTAATHNDFVNLIDIAPTLIESMGVTMPKPSPGSGFNLRAPNRPVRHSFPLMSWVSPLLGVVTDNPPLMHVVNARSGNHWRYAPAKGVWGLTLDDAAAPDESPRLSGSFKDVFAPPGPTSESPYIGK